MGTPEHQPAQEDLRQAPAGELFKRLSEDTSQLVKLELQLAKAEMTDKGKQLGAGAGLLGAAALFGFFAFAAFTTLLIALLATGMKVWIAALIVMVVYAAIAAIAGLTGKGRIQQAGPPVPEQTIETVKEDVEWAKTRSTSAPR
ncbi:MAG: phage holin family protein [Solirubrobacteraceae bacterium]|nr:phage holin family protein [Solirubrobacteraceae bacterium]